MKRFISVVVITGLALVVLFPSAPSAQVQTAIAKCGGDKASFADRSYALAGRVNVVTFAPDGTVVLNGEPTEGTYDVKNGALEFSTGIEQPTFRAEFAACDDTDYPRLLVIRTVKKPFRAAVYVYVGYKLK